MMTTFDELINRYRGESLSEANKGAKSSCSGVSNCDFLWPVFILENNGN